MTQISKKTATFWNKGGTIDPHITYPPLLGMGNGRLETRNGKGSHLQDMSWKFAFQGGCHSNYVIVHRGESPPSRNEGVQRGTRWIRTLDPMISSPTLSTLDHRLQLPNRRKIFAIYALTLLMYTAANPKSAILR